MRSWLILDLMKFEEIHVDVISSRILRVRLVGLPLEMILQQLQPTGFVIRICFYPDIQQCWANAVVVHTFSVYGTEMKLSPALKPYTEVIMRMPFEGSSNYYWAHVTQVEDLNGLYSKSTRFSLQFNCKPDEIFHKLFIYMVS